MFVTLLQISIHQAEGKEILFYAFVGLLLFLAIIRQLFPKYFNDLFRLFFRTTLKQRHLSEQLSQTPLPSFLLNLFFFFSAGLYLCFWLERVKLNPFDSFWWLLLYVIAVLIIAYLVKFISLQFMGWLFKARDAAASYTFTVFTINKMAGLFLWPLLVLMAFSTEQVFVVALTLSWVLLGGLLLYRIGLTYRVVRKQIHLSGFHFLLYVAGFEIAPLAVLYKLFLLNFR